MLARAGRDKHHGRLRVSRPVLRRSRAHQVLVWGGSSGKEPVGRVPRAVRAPARRGGAVGRGAVCRGGQGGFRRQAVGARRLPSRLLLRHACASASGGGGPLRPATSLCSRSAPLRTAAGLSVPVGGLRSTALGRHAANAALGSNVRSRYRDACRRILPVRTAFSSELTAPMTAPGPVDPG